MRFMVVSPSDSWTEVVAGGVISMFRSARSLFNRLDYELAPMARGDRALMGAPHRHISKEDRQFFQDFIDHIYDQFIDRVGSSASRT